jgi:drug/metabolite transporter (DMT)-like permease
MGAKPTTGAGARLQLLIAAVLFSTGGAAIKAVSLNAWQVTAFRCAVAALTLLVFVPETRRGWSWRLMPVALAYAATMFFFVAGNKYTTSANTIFLQSTAPLYLLVFSPLILKERLRREDLWFLFTLAGGMTLFFLRPEAPTATAPNPFLGNLLGAGAGLTWACTLLGLRWLASRESTDGASLIRAVVAGNVTDLVLCAYGAFPVEDSSAVDWYVILYLGAIQIGLAYVLVTSGMKRVPALEASLILLVEPVLNPLWAWLMHDERPGALALTGGAIIAGATCLRIWQQRRV